MKLKYCQHSQQKAQTVHQLQSITIPVQTEVKYLGLHQDQKLTWQKHIKTKRQQLKSTTNVMALRAKI
jgi:hypothetical protein